MKETPRIVLALFPNARGMGYACMDVIERQIVDYGVFNSRPLRNAIVLRRINSLIEYHNPSILLLRNYQGTSAQNKTRLKNLNIEISGIADKKNTSVYSYSRKQMRDVFEQFGASSKEAVANQLIVWFEELLPLKPRKRKDWMDEDYHMGVFDALALIITHQYLAT
ncbi:MAG: hypothetical protein JST90_07285 [Bacteroidetes bacterium]|nr:hypothetical protein [Bacteroidota bacterium]